MEKNEYSESELKYMKLLVLKKEKIETLSTRVFALTANLKRQFQVKRLAFDVYGFHRFS